MTHEDHIRLNTAEKDIPLRVKLIDLLHKHGKGETDEHDGEKIDEMVERIVAERDPLRAEVERLTAEVERLRECLQSMLDAYEELHAKYDLGDCEATIAARAAMSNPTAKE